VIQARLWRSVKGFSRGQREPGPPRAW